jgi:DNA polymerase I-like protein with 3'-5' exonuclease and polymerase domains
MIHLVTASNKDYLKFTNPNFQLNTIGAFDVWLNEQEIIQLDTETLMIDDGPDAVEDRKLILMQFGDIEKKNQWLIHYSIFDDSKLIELLRDAFGLSKFSFIAHNARFEYKVIKNQFGFGVENIDDTYLMSKVLNTGLDLPKGYHSLAGCVKRFLNIELDKSEQTSFTEAPLTYSQIEYAAEDVLHMYDVMTSLQELLEEWGLTQAYKLEKEVMKAYADMEMSPMKFDLDYWDKLSEQLAEDDARLVKELNQLVLNDKKLVIYLANSKQDIGEPLIQPEDKVALNWASPIHRKEALIHIIPELQKVEKFTKPVLKKILKTEELGATSARLLKWYMEREYNKLNRYLRLYCKDWLVEHDWMRTKGEVRINWASNVHKLYIFRYYYPSMENTNAKSLARIYTNPLINKFKEYVKTHKYLTTYGPKFVEKYVRRDGTIAPTGLNQILHTGRVAFGILLQMPAQARFRNAFLPPEDDWVFVDSDYKSAEVAIFASAAGETAFIDAIKDGRDLHMMSASLIFADKWKEVAEPGCVHITEGKKCDCPEHNKLRKQSKAITFGLAYGLGPVGLAERLDITKVEAQELMDKFFAAFPHLHKFFDDNAESGMKNLYIRSLQPVGRIRFFHPAMNEGEKSAIGRQSKNYPIQETNASMLKIALVIMRQKIIREKFPAKLHLPVHDEVLSSCPRDKAKEWKKIQEDAMQKAANAFLDDGLLGVDTEILDRWTK